MSQQEGFWVGGGCKAAMVFSGITITRTRRGTRVPTHSSSTCFMRTDTLQASLVTSLLRGKASAHHIIKVLNNARRQQRRQEREARGKVISVRKLSRTYECKERLKGREKPEHLRGIINKSRRHVAFS